MDIYERLKELGIELFPVTDIVGIYKRAVFFGEGGKMVYVSGTGPACPLGPGKIGKVGTDMTVEEGQEEARRCMLNILSNLQAELGDLNRIKRFVKVIAFVASGEGFYEQPKVANGGSSLLRDVFGDDAGVPARSAVGVYSLPGNIPVEIEVLLELKD